MPLFPSQDKSPHSNETKSHWTKCGPLTLTRQRLREWYENSPGTLLQAAEQQVLDNVLPDLFGYHLLQVGMSYRGDCTNASRIPHRVVMDVDLGEGAMALAPDGLEQPCLSSPVEGMPENLPFGSDSLDVVLLPHTLEFSNNPHEVLREVDRVLIPEGHVVILGFNPWGMWMLWRLVLGWRSKPPWCGRFLRPTRLRDWLQLLGFDVVASRGYFFRPPLHHQGVMQKLQFIEGLGSRLWPFFGGAYLLVARKRVATLTPVRPRWRPRRSRVSAPELAGNSSVTNFTEGSSQHSTDHEQILDDKLFDD